MRPVASPAGCVATGAGNGIGQFAAVSELAVPESGREALEDAFAARLGAVDAWPGFQGLELWADDADRESYMMISWWDTKACFASYMRSADQHRCHARIPDGDLGPRPRRFRRFRRFTVIAR